MLEKFPQHAGKYRWFLDLAQAVERDEALVPETVLQKLVELGALKLVPTSESNAPLSPG